MGMNTKSSRKDHRGNTSKASSTAVEPSGLTEAQKNFARVVGQALAEAWRCKWRQDAAQAGKSGLEVRDS